MLIFFFKGIFYAVYFIPPYMYSSPDDVGHISYIQYIADMKSLPVLMQSMLEYNNFINLIFNENNINIPTSNISYYELLKRPEVNIKFIEKLIPIEYNEEVKEQVEIMVKYEGYIKKAYKEVEKLIKLEEKEIPEDIDYKKIKNLASEARQKLEKIRPKTIAQATRISGVNPVDISVLSIYLKKEYNHE